MVEKKRNKKRQTERQMVCEREACAIYLSSLKALQYHKKMYLCNITSDFETNLVSGTSMYHDSQVS